MAVWIANRQRRLRVDRRALERRAGAILKELPSPGDGAGGEEVSIALVRDRAMRPLNRRFRGRDETTDVLAFPAPPAGEGSGPGTYLGDVVISVDEALRQVEEGRESPEEALDRLLIHGVLHLKGFDHAAPGEAARMRRKERSLRARLAAMREGRRGGRGGKRRGG